MTYTTADIDDYPEFSAWSLTTGTGSSLNSQETYNLAKSIATILRLEDQSLRLELWIAHFSRSIAEIAQGNDVYRLNESLLKKFGLDLTAFISDFASLAIELRYGHEYLRLVEALADTTDLLSYRFLTAWMALNLNEHEKCITECDKVDHPFAAVYTIHGQALLEMGRCSEAIEVLNIAIELDPNEALAQFQLAKASLVSGDTQRAWRAAKVCERISPNNPEVALLLTMIALEGDNIQGGVDEAWDALSAFFCNGCTNEVLIANLLDLAFRRREKNWARSVIENSDWQTIYSQPGIYQKISGILRGLGAHDWLDLAAIVLRDFDQRKMPLSS